jgi:hypothetical protein
MPETANCLRRQKLEHLEVVHRKKPIPHH